MSLLGEKTLLAYLVDGEAMGWLVKEGVDPDIVPTPSMRAVVEFAINHYIVTGKPVSAAMLREEYGEALEVAEVDLDYEPDESVEWALAALKSSYIRKETQGFTKRLGEAITAESADRVEVIAEFSSELTGLALRMQPRRTRVDFRAAGPDMLAEYDYVAANRGVVIGSRIGWADEEGSFDLDDFTGGIRPGELSIFSSPSGTGKSYALDDIALNNWQSGPDPVALFTLENSISMTMGRLACLRLGFNATDWTRGTLSEQERGEVEEWVEDVLKKADTPLYIFSPGMGLRTPSAIVQAARAHDCRTLIVDQLTFVHPDEGKSAQNMAYEVRDKLHTFKELISTGHWQISMWLAHQITRDGIKEARRTGRLEAWHQADSSEVERTADWDWLLWQSSDDKRVQRAKLTCAKSRRANYPRAWDMNWSPAFGMIQVRAEENLSAFVNTEGEA